MQQSNEIVTFSPCASSSVHPGTAKALRKSTWDPIDGNEHMLVAEVVSFFRLARPSRMPVCLPAESLRGEGSPVPPPLAAFRARAWDDGPSRQQRMRR